MEWLKNTLGTFKKKRNIMIIVSKQWAQINPNNSDTINTDVDILGWAQITKTCICSFRGQTTR